MNNSPKINSKTLLPDFPPDYIPNSIEIYDQLGLLVRIENLRIVEENTRPINFTPQLICWYFDGKSSENLAYAHTKQNVLIDRISQLNSLNDILEAAGA